MIRRHVLAALAAGVAAGDDEVARHRLGRIDWILRRPARRRLERALIDAALAVTVEGSAPARDVEADRHVLRLAALDVRGTPAADPFDRASVESAYAAMTKVRPSRVPIATLIAATVAVAAVAGGFEYVATRPGPASRSYTRPMPPPAASAFRTGGVPLRDPAIEAALAGPLTDLVLAVDHPDTTDERVRLGRALRATAAFTMHGTALDKTWHDLLAALDHWEATSAKDFTLAADLVRGAARRFSDECAAAGLGYYIEGDAMTGASHAQALLYVYRIEEIVFVTAGGAPRRVVSLRRIDTLNVVHTLLGMRSDELGDPMLLLDQIDQHVASQVMPVLAADAPFPLSDTSWSPTAPAKELAAAAGAAVRADFATALGPDNAAALRVAALLHERGDILDTWRDTFERRRMRMIDTNDLFLPPHMLEQLEGQVPTYQRERVAAIEDELASLDAPRIASRCHELVAASVRRHEAQHGFDADRETPLRYPPALEAQTGDENDRYGMPRQLVVHARHELDAWLSQIANDPATPQLVAWDLAGHAFSQFTWGRPESYAAVVVIEGLARQLKGPPHDELIHDGEIDRDRLAAVATVITRATDAQLRAAAAALWLELYGEPVTVITDSSAR